MHLNLPNALTWFRIFAIPLVVIVFYLPVHVGAAGRGLLFGLAGITDCSTVTSRAGSARRRASARSSIPSPTS